MRPLRRHIGTFVAYKNRPNLTEAFRHEAVAPTHEDDVKGKYQSRPKGGGRYCRVKREPRLKLACSSQSDLLFRPEFGDEFLQLSVRQIGNREVIQAFLTPPTEVIAVTGPVARGAREGASWPDEYINDMLTTLVNKGGNEVSIEPIKPSTHERKTCSRKINNGW